MKEKKVKELISKKLAIKLINAPPITKIVPAIEDTIPAEDGNKLRHLYKQFEKIIGLKYNSMKLGRTNTYRFLKMYTLDIIAENAINAMIHKQELVSLFGDK